MVLDNLLWEEQTRRLLSEAKSDLSSIQSQRLDLMTKEAELTNEVNAYEAALQGYLKRSGKSTFDEVDWKKLLANATTHKDRIKLITEHYGGSIKPTPLTDILFTQGFIKTKKRANAYQIVQTNLAAMVDVGVMVKTDSGEYRLANAQIGLPRS